MSTHHYSASKREIGAWCLYWARPDVILPPREASAAADLGTALHEGASEEAEPDFERFAELVASGDTSPESLAERYRLSAGAAKRLVDLVDAWRAWWPTYNGGRAWRAEVPFAFDGQTDTARELPSQGQRDYSAATDDELPGTVDQHVVDEHGAVILDLKTGRGPHRLADHVRQLEHGAVVLARMHGLDEVRIVVAHVTPDGVVVDERVLDAFDLEAAAQAMTAELARIPTAEPVDGTHCRWCPARGICPKTTALVAEVLPGALPERRLPLVGAVEDDETARAFIEGLPLLEAWVDDRWKQVRAYAERGAVPLGSGRVWGKVEKPGREKVDLEVKGAIDAINEALGPAAEVALEVETSKSAIERGVRKQLAGEGGGKRGDLGKRKEAILEALRKLGALKRGAPFTVFEAFERKAELPAAGGGT